MENAAHAKPEEKAQVFATIRSISAELVTVLDALMRVERATWTGKWGSALKDIEIAQCLIGAAGKEASSIRSEILPKEEEQARSKESDQETQALMLNGKVYEIKTVTVKIPSMEEDQTYYILKPRGMGPNFPEAKRIAEELGMEIATCDELSEIIDHFESDIVFRHALECGDRGFLINEKAKFTYFLSATAAEFYYDDDHRLNVYRESNWPDCAAWVLILKKNGGEATAPDLGPELLERMGSIADRLNEPDQSRKRIEELLRIPEKAQQSCT